jgi:hypothetical protein
VTGWERIGSNTWSAPWIRTNAVRLLLVNQRLTQRARYPAEGKLKHANRFEVPWMSSTGGGWQRPPTREELTVLRPLPGQLKPGFEPRNAEITVYHMWDESCVGVSAYDAASQILRLAPEPGHPPGAFAVNDYVIWNTEEGLTGPGAWYHDRLRNRIVYWPRPGEEMAKARVIAPTRETILSIRGSRDRRVSGVQIRGLTFSATTVPLISGGFAAAAFPAAISLANTEDCELADLRIEKVAGHAIQGRGDLKGTRVADCEISQCGAGGIYLGGESSIIENNRVHDIGLSYPSAIGIYGGGRQNTVRHNEVFNCSYSAINYGGWENRVEYNRIYHCMQALHDGAAIYMFAATNCVLRGNFAHDITDTGGYGASAYYLDERSFNCVVESNLSLRVNWPVHNHMATNNIIRQNVFIVQGNAKLTFPRSTGYTLERNVIHATGSIRIEGVNAISHWSNNLFHAASRKIEQVTLDKYSTTGVQTGPPAGVIVADPQFKSLTEEDLDFLPGSPAGKLGIAPISAKQAGRQGIGSNAK